jgi:hypothetical protein
VYRFEDLEDRRGMILTKFFHASGLWDQFHVTPEKVKAAVNHPRFLPYKTSSRASLKYFASAHTQFSREEIVYALQEAAEFLTLYGYETLYRIWLRAKDENLTTQQVESLVTQQVVPEWEALASRIYKV